MNNTATSKATTEEREMLDFTVTEKEPFVETYMVEMTPATNIIRLFDKLFGSIFKDYYKCQMVPYQAVTGNAVFDNIFGSALELNLLFRPVSDSIDGIGEDGKIFGFVPKTDDFNKSSNAILNNINAINNRMKVGSQYMISQSACELLRNLFIDSFVIRDYKRIVKNPSPRSFHNANLIGERTIQTSTGYMNYTNIIESIVLHIDVNKLLQLIKGEKNENGDQLTYLAKPVSTIQQNGMTVTSPNGLLDISNTIIEIKCLNKNNIDKLNTLIGAKKDSNEITSPVRLVK